MPSIKGTSSVADSRAFSKALKKTKFPATFHQKVDLTKLNRPVLVLWVEQEITKLLGFEDEIVQSTAVNLFLPERGASDDVTTNSGPEVDPRKAQIDLAGFLGDEAAAAFAAHVWDLMLDANQQSTGIPREILEAKKKELAALAQEEQRKAPPAQQQRQPKPAVAPRHQQPQRAGAARPVSPGGPNPHAEREERKPSAERRRRQERDEHERQRHHPHPHPDHHRHREEDRRRLRDDSSQQHYSHDNHDRRGPRGSAGELAHGSSNVGVLPPQIGSADYDEYGRRRDTRSRPPRDEEYDRRRPVRDDRSHHRRRHRDHGDHRHDRRRDDRRESTLTQDRRRDNDHYRRRGARRSSRRNRTTSSSRSSSSSSTTSSSTSSSSSESSRTRSRSRER